MTKDTQFTSTETDCFEQDWTSPLSHACKVIMSNIPIENTIPVQIDVTPKLNDNLSRSWNIPRSNSLDNNYFTQYYHHKHNLKKDIHSTHVFPFTRLVDREAEEEEEVEEEEEEDEEEGSKSSLLSRSYSYGTKMNGSRELLLSSTAINSNWKLANTTGSDIYPDMKHTSRKPPILGHEIIRIPNQFGTIHAFTVRGSTIVIGTSPFPIKTFFIADSTTTTTTTTTEKLSSPLVSSSSESLHSIHSSSSSTTSSSRKRSCSVSSSDIVRSICFSPAIHPNDDNKIVWAGTENGSILAIDTRTEDVLVKRMATHSHPITFILRHRNTELWTIDLGGNLNVWSVNNNKNLNNEEEISTINLLESIPQRYLVSSNIKTAVLSPKKSILWCSSGRTIDQLDRSEKEAIPLIHIPNDLGDISRLILIPYHFNQIFGLHSDGKITAWNILTREKVKCFVISVDKITSVASVGEYQLWVGYRNGSIAIYDTRSEPCWTVIKIWKAHSNPVTKLEADDFSMIESMSVVSMDSAGHLAIWDGLLADDWFEQQMLANIPDYSTSKETNIMICSWNMDAVKPEALSDWDVEKLHEWLNGMTDPDIIVIGAQEIVDLASKAITAKSFLLSGALKKSSDPMKESSPEELLKHRYKLWHDYFISVIDTNFGKGAYKIIKTAQMIGLFSCIFIKSVDEGRVRQCDSTVVKTGFRVMTKGLHGNKGGIAIRLVLDDTSLCFVNCHLASGQSHVVQRNADMEGVINTAKFTSVVTNEPTIFNRDTDGTNILDHENCFLSGDLNYRIGMQREQVLDLLSKQSTNKFEIWEALQNEDQFKKQQVLNPLFRLFNFKEAPILFDPTYKYDRGEDLYDSSDKRRVPSWCDRVLYRAPSTLTNLYYRRHEVRASDHRPISAGFTIPVKNIIPEKREIVKEQIKLEWKSSIIQWLQNNKVRYVTNYDLCDENEAQSRLKMLDWDVEKVVSNLYRDKGSYY